jgi:hypothetical protein
VLPIGLDRSISAIVIHGQMMAISNTQRAMDPERRALSPVGGEILPLQFSLVAWRCCWPMWGSLA